MNNTAEGRMERKKQETHRKIIAGAMDLFRSQGVDQTTMEQIAREVDIAKGTLYNYFPAKEAIISAYIQQSFAASASDRIKELRNLPDTRSRIRLILGGLMEGVQAQKEIFEKYFVYQIQHLISLHREAGMKSGMRLLAREIITLGQQYGELRTDLPYDILVALFEFTFIQTAQEFYMKPETFDATETIDICIDLFINGAKK